MTFASGTFLLFFAIVLLLLILTDHRKEAHGHSPATLRQGLLLFASYVFYGWWDWRFLFLLFGVTLLSFLLAAPGKMANHRAGMMHSPDAQCGAHPALTEKHPNAPLHQKKSQKARIAAGIAVPLIALGIFKYFDFFLTSFCDAFGLSISPGISIILPVGISFYTFQALSYTIDVYRGTIEKERSFLKYALYISFFPQLVAGPIVKASEFLPQLYEDRSVTLRGLETGLQIFVFGMFKKVVLADNLSVFVDEVYRTPGIFSRGTLLLAAVSYGIQIYMDFSGYSDMAIGCAKCMGYDLRKNFDLPYLSHNVSEFWKRWHISLSSWLQQYLYIPLGGNRRGQSRMYLNLMITMLLGGLWHGASWTFVLWGGLHGLALCIHKGFRSCLRRLLPADGPSSAVSAHRHPVVVKVLLSILCILLTDAFVCLLWIFFRAETISDALLVLSGILTRRGGVVHIYSHSIAAILLLFAASLIAVIRANKQQPDAFPGGHVHGFYPILPLRRFWALVIFFTEIGLILGLAYVGGNPFIYFQF